MRPALSLKGRALKYLSMREHSRMELARKLAPHVGPDDQLDTLLDELETAGWLSAERFVESVLHRKAARMGTARLQQELARHGLPSELCQTALSELRHTDYERAHALWAKRYGQPPQSPQEYARQARFLAGRGFDTALVRQLLKNIEKN